MYIHIGTTYTYIFTVLHRDTYTHMYIYIETHIYTSVFLMSSPLAKRAPYLAQDSSHFGPVAQLIMTITSLTALNPW